MASPAHTAITGSSGLVGRALTAALESGGHRVTRLVRGDPRGPSEVRWDPGGDADLRALEGIDAVVHLAGENIARRRWSAEQKRRIADSRVQGTRALVAGLARLAEPPRVMVAASGVGYYGDRGDEQLDETSSAGRGFLADTCIAWEEASSAAARLGTRVVQLRSGVVLSREGGLAARLVPVFRLGLGGRVGDGRQFMSWIALGDLVAVIAQSLADARLAGPINAVAPHPVRNEEFTRALGRALHRPTLLPLPAPIVRLAFGEMGKELLLASQRAHPRRLEQLGFHWSCGDVSQTLRMGTAT